MRAALALMTVSLVLCACADDPLSGADDTRSSAQALTVTAPVQLAAPSGPWSTTSTKRDLSMATDPLTASSLVAWVDDRSGFPELMGQRCVGMMAPVDVGGQLLSLPAQPVGGTALVWAGSQYFAAWSEPGNQVVKGRKVATGGAPANTVTSLAGPADVLIGLAAQRPTGASMPRSMLLAWVPLDGGTSLMTTRIDSSGAVDPPRPLRSRAFGKVAQIAVAGDLDFYVAWLELTPDAGEAVVGSWVDGTTGIALTTPKVFPHAVQLRVTDPAVAVRGPNALVAWTDTAMATGGTNVTWMLDSSASALGGLSGEQPAVVATDAGFTLVLRSRVGQQMVRVDLVPPFNAPQMSMLAGVSQYSQGRPAATADSTQLQVAWLGQPTGGLPVIDEAVWLRSGGVPTPQRLSTSTARQTHPKVSLNGTRALVAWNEERWPQTRLYVQELRDNQAGLPSFSVPLSLTIASELPGPPDVAHSSDGTFGVAYAVGSVPASGLQAVWLAEIRDGIVIRQRELAMPGDVSAPPAVTGTDDGFVVEWGSSGGFGFRQAYRDGGLSPSGGALISVTPVELDIAVSNGRPATVWSDGTHVYLGDTVLAVQLDELGAMTNTQPVIAPSTRVAGGFEVAFIATTALGVTMVARRTVLPNSNYIEIPPVTVYGATGPAMAPGGVVAVQIGFGMSDVVLLDLAGTVTRVSEGGLPSIDVRPNGRGVVVFQSFDRKVTNNNFVLLGATFDLTVSADGGVPLDGGSTPDAGAPDAGAPDGGQGSDGGSPDGGGVPQDDGGTTADGGTGGPVTFDTCGCASSGPFGAVLMALLSLLRRRRLYAPRHSS